MNWKNKKVLVTGADGFIGSHLTERLVELGVKVRALVYYNSFNSWGWLDSFPKETLNKIEIIQGDIRDIYNLRSVMKNVDIVFHLAALIAIPYSYISPVSYIKTNIEGTLNVLQVATDLKLEKVIHTSTSETYGTAQYIPIDENHPLQGQSPYSASKIGADMIAESFYCAFNLPVATARPFNTYGPRQSARAVIPTIVSQIISNSSIRLGSLNPTRDFVYVKDTVEGLIAVAQSDKSVGEVINIGTGVETSIGDLFEKIKTVLGKDVKVTFDEERVRPEKSEVLRLCASTEKAAKLLNFQTKYTLEEGLKETIDWIKKHLEIFKADVYNL